MKKSLKIDEKTHSFSVDFLFDFWKAFGMVLGGILDFKMNQKLMKK